MSESETPMDEHKELADYIKAGRELDATVQALAKLYSQVPDELKDVAKSPRQVLEELAASQAA
jgi:hypothetical protein